MLPIYSKFLELQFSVYENTICSYYLEASAHKNRSVKVQKKN